MLYEMCHDYLVYLESLTSSWSKLYFRFKTKGSNSLSLYLEVGPR